MTHTRPEHAGIAVTRRRRAWAASVIGLALLAGCAATTPQADPQTAGAPPRSESTLRLAEATLNGGDAEAAIELYRRATAVDPTAVEPKLGLARAYFAIGALPEARDAFARLHRAAPTEAALGLGRVALAQGDPAEARRRFGEVLKVRPDAVVALNGTAVAYDLEGRHREAQRLYAEALELAPANRAVANNAALSLVLAGDVGQAVRRLRDLADAPMAPSAARHNLALALGLAGDEAAARDLLESELDPTAVASNLEFYRTARRFGDIAPAAGGEE